MSRVFAALSVGLISCLLTRGLVVLAFDLFGRGVIKGNKLNWSHLHSFMFNESSDSLLGYFPCAYITAICKFVSIPFTC